MVPGLSLVLALWAFAAPAWAGVNQALGWGVSDHGPQGAALILTDIHFDPLADPALAPALAAAPVSDWEGIFRKGASRLPSPRGSDTNWALWQETLGALARPGVRYDYVLLLGDYVVHKFDRKYGKCVGGNQASYHDFVLKTLLYLQASLGGRLKGTPLYWTLGNNDSDLGDYGLAAGSPLLADLSRAWSSPAWLPGARADFSRGGYYEASLPGRAGRLIVLNSTLWSSAHLNRDEGPGFEELDWLGKRLDEDEGRGRPVWAAMHIPPGINAYSSVCGEPAKSFLKPEYAARLLRLLRAHARSLRLVFGSHTHNDETRVLETPAGPVGMHLALSVSPVHGNNPGFQVELYRRGDGRPLDLAVYTLKNLDAAADGSPPEWDLEYGFRKAYGQAFDARGLAAMALEISGRPAIAALYRDYYSGGAGLEAGNQDMPLRAFPCSLTSFDPDTFSKCACGAGN